MKYSPSFFKRGLPAWKRKKDPVLSRIFYRPVSFLTASLCANLGITANQVSYTSAIVGAIGSLLFLTGDYACSLAGAILINVWLIMDCTDGNLARCVKKQAFGPFADSMSSYMLVAMMCPCMGVSVYFLGGSFIEPGCIWMVVLGALGGMSDTLMRLIYQKYKNTLFELNEAGVIPKEKEKRTDPTQVGSFQSRVENELGIGGILPPAILIATIFNAVDIVVVYCFLYYGLSMIVAVSLYARKAILAARKYEIK